LAWLLWTLATVIVGLLSTLGAEALGWPVVWGLYVRTAGDLGAAAVTGAIIGFAQWLVMRPFLPVPRWALGFAQWLVMCLHLPKSQLWLRMLTTTIGFVLWTLATSLGLVLGIIVLAQSRPYVQLSQVDLIMGFIGDGVILGVVVGLCQWLALQPYVRGAILWWPATILGLAPFFAIRAGLTREIGKALFASKGSADSLAIGGWISVSVALLVLGAVTGLAFAFLVRRAKALTMAAAVQEVTPM
jgi:hypothetical protein